MRYTVLREESQWAVQPFLAPPFPAATSALARPGQMAPNPRLYPVSDVAQTPTRVWPIEKYFTPTAQDRIDLLITPPTGWEREARKIPLSFATESIRSSIAASLYLKSEWRRSCGTVFLRKRMSDEWRTHA
jgi:hypothetical protein